MLLWTKMFTRDFNFQNAKYYADMRGSSRENRRQITVGSSKTAFGCCTVGTFRNEANAIVLALPV